MARLGRKPTGTKLLDKFTASPQAQGRMRAILETLSGQKTICEACAELELGEAMFHRIRDQALAAALTALEPKPMGRPRTTTTAQSSVVAALEQENQDLKVELRAAQVRAEIAQSMPHLLTRKGRSEKKKDEPLDARKDLEPVPAPTTTSSASRTFREPGAPCHFELLKRCAANNSAPRRASTRRGPLAQHSRRELEVQVRVRAVELGDWAHGRGLLWIEVAACIGLSPRTLSAWRSRRTRDRLQPWPRGRRSTRSSRDQRNAVVHFINDRGPCVGLPTLRAAFPTMWRSELADRLAHYRTVAGDSRAPPCPD